MGDLAPGEIKFLLYSAVDGEDVSASVFATKLGQLVKAVKAADRAINPQLSHDYKIAKLHSSTPTVILREVALDPEADLRPSSGVEGFAICADAVTVGASDALRFGDCAKSIKNLASGSSETYGFAEVWTSDKNVIRIDDVLKERASALIAPAASAATWYTGAVVASFDGVMKAVDLRGARPETKLALTAGGNQIDCVCRADHAAMIESLRASLDRRVRVTGRALYDGRSGLPRRLEISAIDLIASPGDFSKWAGSFDKFSIPDWEGDFD